MLSPIFPPSRGLQWLGAVIGLIAAGCRPAVKVEEPPAVEPVSPPQAELFAPGVVSSEAPEFATSFSADGRRVYFNRASADRSRITIVEASRDGETWREKGELPFTGQYLDVDPFVSADGSRLYFSSNRPATGDGPADDFDVWYVERREEGWGDPVRLDPPVNGPGTEVFASLAASGTIYFASDRDGVSDIHRAVAVGKGFAEPQRLLLATDEESSVGNPWVAADESFVVVSSGRPGGLGGSDLWISFRQEAGWSAPANLGPAVNSPQADFAPCLSPDSRYLYFTSERPGIVAAGEVEGRPPGDIYRIELGPLLDRIGR